MRDLAALVQPLSSPAVHLVGVNAPSKSYFGGTPRLPDGVPWPQRHGRSLGFLARLSLAELHRAQRFDWLPSAGALLFFYDLEEQPWGFDPLDRGGCAVLHVSDLAQPVAPGGEDDNQSFARLNLAARGVRVLPSGERDEVRALGLSEEEGEAYWQACDELFHGLPKHQVGGLPTPVQGDSMELECQLVTNGLYCGNSSGYDSPRTHTRRGRQGLALTPAA